MQPHQDRRGTKCLEWVEVLPPVSVSKKADFFLSEGSMEDYDKKKKKDSSEMGEESNLTQR